MNRQFVEMKHVKNINDIKLLQAYGFMTSI